MTPKEKESADKIARLMRAARKRVGLTQIDISKKLGISQSALSKIENGILIPSAPQWFAFASATGIAADNLVTGFIERSLPASIANEETELPFKVARRYSRFRGSKVRAVLPFLEYFIAEHGPNGKDKLDQYLRSIKVDPDYFIDLDNQINFQFILDLTRRLIDNGNLKAKDLSKLVKPIAQPATHGSLHKIYDGAESSINRVQLLLQNSKLYECNFDYKVEEVTSKGLVFSATPQPHLEEFNFKNDVVLGDFVCRYKKAYFESFFQYGNGKSGTIVDKECIFHGSNRCIYELNAA